MKMFGRIGRVLLLLFVANLIHAQDLSGLLPIDEAYKLSADTGTPGVIKLHWTIAPDYYLYRGQMRFTGGDGVTLGAAQLPDGKKYHDEYLGDVETYHNSIDASIPYTLAPGTQRIKLAVRYQGCHEVDPKICYPPHVENLDLPLSSTLVSASSNGASHPIQSPAHASMQAPENAKSSAASNSSGAGLLVSLLLAFAGGLVLNLMPCVLPVLSIKAVGLLESGESVQRARRHALAYTAGVLCSFAAIGLAVVTSRSAGHALGWGAQLQQPLVVGVLACVMVAVGLSMSGVVQFGASFGNLGHGLASRSGWGGDFFTGVLAVAVASPCVAPFMGTALAYAFLAPTLAALLVFLALGFGLALPFLLVGFVPALGRLLPRPGAWMETLKQVLAFPMYLTAVWLIWVLAHQRGADAVGLVLTAAVMLAMTLWWIERSRHRGEWAKLLAVVLVVLTALPLYWLGYLQPVSTEVTQEVGVIRFSPQKLTELRQSGTPVFVDMTADWCITCKANEHAVLDTPAFHDLLQGTGTVYMKGDWTNVDPMITAFLQKYHSPGVPLYVVFPKGDHPEKVLPSVLTLSLMRQALTTAAVR
jgi:thiol:disulfide interchange protein